MALSLKAEQKNIKGIFYNGEDVYVIPEYQRPYSWNRDTCYQLYLDITTSFCENKEYFVGNIIVARGSEQKEFPNVVDGQQRLITLWIFIKVLGILNPEIAGLKKLLESESLMTGKTSPRIDSHVFEHDDQKNIFSILKYEEIDFERLWIEKSKSEHELKEEECSNIEANALYIYKWLKEFYLNTNSPKGNVQGSFVNFFLDRVYLLPIELGGDSILEANDKALTIFETFNNRGQVLEDSDIFKARLYKSAKAEGCSNEFIERWTDLNVTCSDLNIKVDDLFRYYYHILRAKEGKTANEESLREYLTHDKESALNVLSYREIIKDLSKISEILQRLNSFETLNLQTAKYIQILNNYSNQYPRYALVNYIFINGFNDENELNKFLRNIVRYYFYRGATLQVKYETYRINKIISNHLELPQYDTSDINPDTFNHIGSLKNGYALLVHYLRQEKTCEDDKFYANLNFDRLVSKKDTETYPNNWPDGIFDEIKNNIANIVVLDIPKRSLSLKQKSSYYSKSKFKDVTDIFGASIDFTYEEFKIREKEMKNLLMDFFNN